MRLHTVFQPPLRPSVFGISVAALAAALAGGACSDDDPNRNFTTGNGGGGSTGVSTGGSTTSAGGGEGDACLNDKAQKCEAPKPAFNDLELEVGVISVVILDQNGQPAADMISDVCGTNICAVYGHTEMDGSFTGDAQMTNIFDPLLLYGDGLSFAKMGAVINEPAVDFGTINVIRLPPVAQGVAFCTGTEATSNGVTVAVPEGASISIDKLLYVEPSQRGFRAAVVDAATVSNPDIPAAIELLVATAPIDTVICPGAKLTFPNSAAWAEGTVVDVMLYGSRISGHYVPYGEWGKIATATVTADGIVTNDGEEIEPLGLFGLAPQL